MWPIGIPLIDAIHKIAMPHTITCFHVKMPQKFLQIEATRLYLHRFQPLLIQML